MRPELSKLEWFDLEELRFIYKAVARESFLSPKPSVERRESLLAAPAAEASTRFALEPVLSTLQLPAWSWIFVLEESSHVGWHDFQGRSKALSFGQCSRRTGRASQTPCAGPGAIGERCGAPAAMSSLYDAGRPPGCAPDPQRG